MPLKPQELPELTRTSIPPIPDGVTDSYIRGLCEEVFTDIDNYAGLRAEALRVRQKLDKSGLEEALVVFGPFLVSAAIGLSLFKALYGH